MRWAVRLTSGCSPVFGLQAMTSVPACCKLLISGCNSQTVFPAGMTSLMLLDSQTAIAATKTASLETSCPRSNLMIAPGPDASGLRRTWRTLVTYASGVAVSPPSSSMMKFGVHAWRDCDHPSCSDHWSSSIRSNFCAGLERARNEVTHG